jgi:hypothetical protein
VVRTFAQLRRRATGTLLAVFGVASASAQPSNYVLRLQTIGSSFSPAAYCVGGPPSTYLWTWSDATTATNYPIPTKSFGSNASRIQYLTVLPSVTLTQVNLGFDGSDSGWTNVYAMRPSQGVKKITFQAPLTNLQYFSMSYNPITNVLDLTEFTNLQNLECWHCTNLQHVVVSNLPSIRRVCFEACSLQELDLSGDPNLEDMRGALNAYTGITLGRGTGPKIWHWCLRDNPQITQDFMALMTNFYSLKEPWFWNANQGGALKFVSTNLTDVEVYINHYDSADFTGESQMWECWVYQNNLTNLIIDGCPSLQTFDAHNNLLPGTVLDNVLAALDTSATNLSFADLRNNAQTPSYIGYAHFANLTNRGASVYVDWPGGAVTWPQVRADTTTLTAESCPPANGAIDPGETVTVQFGLRNVGTRNTTNLVATLLATNGVVLPSSSQNYGRLVAGGAAVTKPFTFSAMGNCGSMLTASFRLQDDVGILGTISFTFQLGQTVAFFTNNFDSVTAPALPLGWTSSATGAQIAWVTTNSTPDTSPNCAMARDIAGVGLTWLVSPAITLSPGQTQLTFRNYCDLEPAADGVTAYDGGVLEIQIGSGAFTDILAAGGSFVSGGYTRTVSAQYQNPLGGRPAWSGHSSGYTNTIVILPAAAAGQTIHLRWGCGTDTDNGSGGGAGWRIDSVALVASACCVGPLPVLPAQSDRTIKPDTPLIVTNSATETGSPPNVLAYQLISPPAGAVINADGIIAWIPALAQAGSSNLFVTVVTDNALMPMSATNSFHAFVSPLPSAPSILFLTPHTNAVTLSWSAAAGQVYRVQFKNSLEDTNWTDLVPDITATGPTAWATNSIGISSQGFYRVILLP